MTTINLAFVSQGGNIPDDLPMTLEAVLFYLGGKYNQIYGAATYSELNASAVDNGQRTIGSADVVQTPAGPRGIVRSSMPIAPDWAEAGPAYASILPQSAALLP